MTQVMLCFGDQMVDIINQQPCMQGTCEELRPFRFYSINEFQYRQLISKSRYFVGQYVHLATNVHYIIKEVPYLQMTVQILKKIEKIKSNSVVPIVGACLLRSKVGWVDNLRMKNQDERKQCTSLLLFMEKYEMNLHQYVKARRKSMNLFTEEEVRSFLQQMLQLLCSLQRLGIAHRDIKPENILISKGTFLLCDFEDAIEIVPGQRPIVDLTTVEYSSPEYLRHIRHPKDKYFDSFKLDVYSFGLTLLFLCSTGRFSLQQRGNYIYESSQHSHADFMKDQRIKWIKNQQEMKVFNDLVKMMLEQDEYKRDDFVTLTIKSKLKNDLQRTSSLSDDNSIFSKSSARKPIPKIKKSRIKGTRSRQRQLKVYGVMSGCMMVIFILFCLL